MTDGSNVEEEEEDGVADEVEGEVVEVEEEDEVVEEDKREE